MKAGIFLSTAQSAGLPPWIGWLSGNIRGGLAGLLLMVTGVRESVARPETTSWTNVDGVTIRARFVGWDRTHVILFRNGRDYKVPVSRLTPESADKARVLLGLEPKHPAGAAMAGTTRKGERAPGGATERKPGRSDASALAVAGRDPVNETPPEAERIPLPEDKLASAAVTAGPATAELPEFSESEEIDSASFGAVLPEREPAVLPVDPPVAESGRIRLEGRRAIAPASAPFLVRTAIAAANHLQTKP